MVLSLLSAIAICFAQLRFEWREHVQLNIRHPLQSSESGGILIDTTSCAVQYGCVWELVGLALEGVT